MEEKRQITRFLRLNNHPCSWANSYQSESGQKQRKGKKTQDIKIL